MRTAGSSHDRWRQRRDGRRNLRRFPPPIRKLLRSVKNPYVLDDVLDALEKDVDHLAEQRGLLDEHGRIHEVDRRELVRGMANDKDYMNRVRNLTNDARRRTHVGWVRRNDRESFPEHLPTVVLPKTGEVNLRGDLGVGTAAFLEAMPDEVAVGLVRELADREDPIDEELKDMFSDWGDQFDDTVGLEDRDRLRVLVAFAGPSTFAHVADAVLAPFDVVEVDAVSSERETLCVDRRVEWLHQLVDDGPLFEAFDVVVWHLPAPSHGAADKHRFIYYEDQRVRPLPPMDPGRRGPKAWRQILADLIDITPSLLRPHGRIAFLLPRGVRHRSTYVPEPDLLNGVVEEIDDAGLVIDRDLTLHEVQTKAQPFVGHRRCPWRLITTEPWEGSS